MEKHDSSADVLARKTLEDCFDFFGNNLVEQFFIVSIMVVAGRAKYGEGVIFNFLNFRPKKESVKRLSDFINKSLSARPLSFYRANANASTILCKENLTNLFSPGWDSGYGNFFSAWDASYRCLIDDKAYREDVTNRVWNQNTAKRIEFYIDCAKILAGISVE